MMHVHVYVYVLCLLCWLCTTAAAANTSNSRDLAVYALYNIPSFALTFTTSETTELKQVLDGNENELPYLISETDKINSSLSFPIRTTTQDFLLEQFQQHIMDTGKAGIYNHLQAVDLPTKLYVVQDGTYESNRSLSLSLRQNGSRQLSSKVTLRAEMFGSIAFLEPSDKSTKPSNEDIRKVFGEWLEDVFLQDRDAFLRALVQAEQELLREIVSLNIQTNLDDSQDQSSSTYVQGWSERTEKAFLTLLVILGIMGIGWMLLYFQQWYRIQQKKNLNEVMYGNYHDDEEDEEGNHLNAAISRPPAVSSRERNSSMDAVRHGDDVYHRNSVTSAHSILEASDRYLSKHRPEWANTIQTQDSQDSGWFSRNYNTVPANPFEYIYQAFSSASGEAAPNQELYPSPRGAFTPTNSNSSARISQPNLSAKGMKYRDQYPNEQQHETHQQWPASARNNSGYTPISTIWRNLSNMVWDGPTMMPNQSQSQDGLVIFEDPQDPMPLACEEDHQDYNFAFSDFPRHDGTPCLIYSNKDEQDTLRRVFEIGNDDDDHYYDDDDNSDALTERSMDDLAATTPLSDQAFAKMLSTHHDDSNSSLEELSSPTSQSVEFQDKLSRLMQQKHRQYEKKSIVEKHREQRREERLKQRREMQAAKHKTLTREIEALEHHFSSPLERYQLSPARPMPTTAGSPKPYSSSSYSPARKIHYSPQVPSHSKTMTSSYSPKLTYRNGNHLPRSPKAPSHAPTASQQQQNASPAYRPSGVFRPSPKTISTAGQVIGRTSSTGSDRSISPPGGLEDAGDDIPRGGGALRPRTTKHPPGDNWYSDTARVLHGEYPSAGLDDYVETLSMPMMLTSPPAATIGCGAGVVAPKYPSPNSVMDEFGCGVPTPLRKKAPHRRVNSFSDMPHALPQQHQQLYRSTTPMKGGPPPSHHRRTNSTTTTTQYHQRTPSKGHRRSNSNSSSHRRSHSNSSSHRRGHSRSNSASSDVFLHGIFAQTRFV